MGETKKTQKSKTEILEKLKHNDTQVTPPQWRNSQARLLLEDGGRYAPPRQHQERHDVDEGELAHQWLGAALRTGEAAVKKMQFPEIQKLRNSKTNNL